MKTIKLDELMERLRRRKAELGITGHAYVAVNPGGRRTASKRALLEAIKKEDERRNRLPRFAGNI